MSTENMVPRFDALLPPEIARKAESIGAQKTRQDVLSLLVLSVLAGAFIALGAMFATTVLTGTDGVVPFGISRLLAGSVFCLGLILVIVGGAELFTGNTLIVMAWAAGEVRLIEMLRVWLIVYAGNFVGAVGTAALGLPFRAVSCRSRRGRRDGDQACGSKSCAAIRSRSVPRDSVQRAGLPCGLAFIWWAHDHRQSARRRLSGLGLRRGRLRAFGCEHVSRSRSDCFSRLGGQCGFGSPADIG